jgi:hypothetical protein
VCVCVREKCLLEKRNCFAYGSSTTTVCNILLHACLQVDQFGSDLRWNDRCEFELDSPEEAHRGGLVLRARLVKSRRARAGAAAVRLHVLKVFYVVLFFLVCFFEEKGDLDVRAVVEKALPWFYIVCVCVCGSGVYVSS